jgi:methionyl-tRNA formyltransferase
MAGRFSAIPLAALLTARLPVVGVVVPGLARPGAPPIVQHQPPSGGRGSLPLLGPAGAPTVLDLAGRHGLPAYAVSRLADAATLATLAALGPDLIVVACFPRRLPAVLLALAPLGGVNLHPSLLPAGRGPNPRFWTFRHGLPRGGVTVHQMTDDLDAGPILAQTSFELPDGLTGAAFDETAAGLGADLLVQVARNLGAGRARPVPQDPARATYDPAPTEADYLVPTDRPARWAYNFIRGVADDGRPLAFLLDRKPVPIRAALAYQPTDDPHPVNPVGADGVRWMRCRPGWLQVRLA